MDEIKAVLKEFEGLILSHDILKNNPEEDAYYYKLSLKLKNGNRLIIEEHMTRLGYRYSYQWMEADNTLIIRWDNARYELKEVSIIEAFMLKSVGQKNIEIAKHIYKTINTYNDRGYRKMYVVIYAQAVNFHSLWENYKSYVNKLNEKRYFDKSNYKQIGSLKEVQEEYDILNLKKGITQYQREGQTVEIYHFFVNMYL